MRFIGCVVAVVAFCSCSEKQSEAPAVSVPKNSVQEPIDLNAYLAGKVVELSGDHLTSVSKDVAPEKYYAFYYTASYCAPCKVFSPTLVTFYEVYQEIYGAQFEIVLVSDDKTESKMAEYAKQMGMKFPHISLSEVSAFKENFSPPAHLYPSLVICTPMGEVLKTSFDKNGLYHGVEIPMNYLKTKLSEE